jgi:hypothetical protein
MIAAGRIEMLKRLMLCDEVAATKRWLDSDELKAIVRDAMILMAQAEREQLVIDIEQEMNRAGLSMRSHLIMIGIPAASLEELTPNEVGHFIRFVDLTAPRLMPAIERVLSPYIAFFRDEDLLASRPAA